MSEIISIGTITSIFSLNKDEAHKILLRHSNKIGVVLMDWSDDGGYIVPRVVYDEIVRTAKTLDGLIISLDVLDISDIVSISDDTFVYFLYDDHVLVYIGQISALMSRISTHKKDKGFNKIVYISVGKDELNMVEGINIYHYKPKYNLAIWSNLDRFKAILDICDFQNPE